MIDKFIKPYLDQYEKLLVSRLVWYVLLLGGATLITFALCVVLFLEFPAYRWYIFAGLVVVWLIKLLLAYGYMRLVKAEQEARVAASAQVDQMTDLALNVINTALKLYNRPDKHH